LSATALDVQTGRSGSKLTASKSVVRVLRRIVGDPGDTDAVTILQDVIPRGMLRRPAVPGDHGVDLMLMIHVARVLPSRQTHTGVLTNLVLPPCRSICDDLEAVRLKHLTQRLSASPDVGACLTEHTRADEDGATTQNLQKTSSVHPLPSKKAKPAELAGWLKKCAMPAEYTKIVRMHCTSLSPHHSCSGVCCDLDIIFDDRTPPDSIGSLPLRHSEGMNLVRPKS